MKAYEDIRRVLEVAAAEYLLGVSVELERKVALSYMFRLLRILRALLLLKSIILLILRESAQCFAIGVSGEIMAF